MCSLCKRAQIEQGGETTLPLCLLYTKGTRSHQSSTLIIFSMIYHTFPTIYGRIFLRQKLPKAGISTYEVDRNQAMRQLPRAPTTRPSRARPESASRTRFSSNSNLRDIAKSPCAPVVRIFKIAPRTCLSDPSNL